MTGQSYDRPGGEEKPGCLKSFLLIAGAFLILTAVLLVIKQIVLG
jgi:hypothetical protein